MTNKKLISKDSVMKLLGDHFNIYENLFIEQIDALPTFSPEAIIEEMIEDVLNPEGTTIDEKRLRCLEDVLGKIKGEPPSRHCIT